MKTLAGLLLAIGLLACALVFGPGCAHWHEDWEAKCGPQVDPTLKPCSCFDPRTPTCPAPPSDAKKPKTDGGQTP